VCLWDHGGATARTWATVLRRDSCHQCRHTRQDRLLVSSWQAESQLRPAAATWEHVGERASPPVTACDPVKSLCSAQPGTRIQPTLQRVLVSCVQRTVGRVTLPPSQRTMGSISGALVAPISGVRMLSAPRRAQRAHRLHAVRVRAAMSADRPGALGWVGIRALSTHASHSRGPSHPKHGTSPGTPSRCVYLVAAVLWSSARHLADDILGPKLPLGAACAMRGWTVTAFNRQKNLS